MTPLHDVDALATLAETAHGRAQTWAATRLATVAPDRFAWMPETDRIHDEVVFAAPRRLPEVLIRALTTPTYGAAITASLACEFGVITDIAAFAEALRAAPFDGSAVDLWRVNALAVSKAARASDLSVAAKSAAPERDIVLPTIVLRVADQLGALDEAARDVAKALVPRGTEDVATLIGLLGAPIVPDVPDDVPGAIAAGARRAGAAPPQVRRHKGSRARQVCGAIQELCDGVPGPLAGALRALAGANAPLDHAAVAVAAWTRTFTPGDPVHDVLSRGQPRDAARFAAARAAIGPEHADRVRAAVERPHDAIDAAIVAMPLVRADPSLASHVVRRIFLDDHMDDVAMNLALATAWHCADDVVEMLRDRDLRDWGLFLASRVPTEEVLAALLAMPVPADVEARSMYAVALANMGEPAVLPHLEALDAADASGGAAEALDLARALLSPEG